MAEIVGAIEFAMALFETIVTIKELFNDHTSAISLDQIKRVMEDVLVKWVAKDELTKVQNARNNFFNVILKDLRDPAYLPVTQEALKDASSPIHQTYRLLADIVDPIDEDALPRILLRLTTIYKDYVRITTMHPDDAMTVFLSFFHGYTLLFYAYAVYFQLRRIEVGATSLDDPKLNHEARVSLQFFEDGYSMIRAARPDDIVQINASNFTCGLRVILVKLEQTPNPLYKVLKDYYKPLESTPSNLYLAKPTDETVEPFIDIRHNPDDHYFHYLHRVSESVYSTLSGYDANKKIESSIDLLRKRVGQMEESINGPSNPADAFSSHATAANK